MKVGKVKPVELGHGHRRGHPLCGNKASPVEVTEDQNSALTCAVTSEILCIASVTCWAGAYKRKHTPSSGTISKRPRSVDHVSSS